MHVDQRELEWSYASNGDVEAPRKAASSIHTVSSAVCRWPPVIFLLTMPFLAAYRCHANFGFRHSSFQGLQTMLWCSIWIWLLGAYHVHQPSNRECRLFKYEFCSCLTTATRTFPCVFECSDRLISTEITTTRTQLENNAILSESSSLIFRYPLDRYDTVSIIFLMCLTCCGRVYISSHPSPSFHQSPSTASMAIPYHLLLMDQAWI